MSGHKRAIGTEYRINRGGGYAVAYYNEPVSDRDFTFTDSSNTYISSRVALYVGINDEWNM